MKKASPKRLHAMKYQFRIYVTKMTNKKYIVQLYIRKWQNYLKKHGKEKYKIHENGRGSGEGKWMSTLSYW